MNAAHHIRYLSYRDVGLLVDFMLREQESMEIPVWDFSNRERERSVELNDAMNIVTAAFIDDVIVGICFIIPGKKSSNSHIGTLRLDVVEEHRHSGIGSELLSNALERADRAGIIRVTATPYDRFDKNLNESLVFFSNHGFVLEGKARKGARLANGELVDTWLMARVRD